MRETPESFLQKVEEVEDSTTMKTSSGFCEAESGFVPQAIYSPAIYVKGANILLINAPKPLKPPLLEF